MNETDGITRLLMIKEAVASHNIEHPDNPITVRGYLLAECLRKSKYKKSKVSE